MSPAILGVTASHWMRRVDKNGHSKGGSRMNGKRALVIMGLLSLAIIGSGMNPIVLRAQETKKQDCKPADGKPCCPAGMNGASNSMNKKMSGRATMGEVFSADKLYQCREHREIISTQADAACPHHDAPAQLKRMSRSQVKKLRKAELYACPMCPVVKAEGDGEMKCTICSMDLLEVEEIIDGI